MRNFLPVVILASAILFPACTAYVQPPPPPARVEVRSRKPHKRAVWIAGHWAWRGRRAGYVWVPGHWKKVK